MNTNTDRQDNTTINSNWKKVKKKGNTIILK